MAAKELLFNTDARAKLKKGDRVLVSKYGGTEIKLDGKEYKIFSSDDLLAIID